MQWYEWHKVLETSKKEDDLAAHIFIDWSVFLIDSNTKDWKNQQGHYQGSDKLNENTANFVFGLQKYKTLLSFVRGAIVGNMSSNDN